MIYDAFIFYNELELLDIRLNILNEHVGRFVLVEGTKTFQGDAKPLYFQENKQRYKNFLHKITHIVVDDMPTSDNPFDLEDFQRDAILRGLTECAPSDLIMISDVDEIPNPSKIPVTLIAGKRYTFSQALFYYRMNCLCRDFTDLPWTTIVLRKDLTAPSEIRKALGSLHSSLLAFRKNEGAFVVIPDGGWHFSYLGGADFIANKIRSYSHKEFNTGEMTDLERINHAIDDKTDLFGRDLHFEIVKFNGLPEYVQKNQARYLASGLLTRPDADAKGWQEIAADKRRMEMPEGGKVAAYEEIRNCVFTEIDRRNQNALAHPESAPSDYWKDFVEYFKYVYSLPDWELKNIRRHTYHLTSDGYQRYYFATPAYRNLLIRGFAFFLSQLDGFRIDEGYLGIGVDAEKDKISHDLLRYLGMLADLVKSGAMSQGCSRSASFKVLEIGGGYGGLARCMVEGFKNVSYCILDIEETLFFPAVYLKNTIGGERVVFVTDGVDEINFIPGRVYLIPRNRWNILERACFDLVLSQQSLQEMTLRQVDKYMDFVARKSRLFFSCNIADHGELAASKNLVLNLTDYLDAKFGSAIWIGERPEPEFAFGDNHLQRRLYSINHE